MKKHDVAIIGAGPAGIMAAITASQNGNRVVLIEKNAQVGRKILATGNGRCNLTNMHVSVENFRGASPGFIETVIGQFDQHATMAFFESLGLLLKEEDNGRVFPRTNQASSVAEVLKRRLAANKVDVVLEAQVAAIEKPGDWKISLTDGRHFESDNVIIATGGRAAPQLGSTGDGLGFARKLGHTYAPTYAALVPVETVETWPSDIQGTKVEACVSATSNGKSIGESTGDLQFTSYGVSGPSVMALSGIIAPLLKTSEVQLHIDLFPDATQAELDRTLLRILESAGRTPVRESLIGLIHSSLIPIVLTHADIDELEHSQSLPKPKRLDITRTLKDLTLTVSKLRPQKEAQVTAGGITAEEIDPQTLQSKLIKGLYFAGELIDVDGDSGGYNLQWAWSSGHVAGRLA